MCRHHALPFSPILTRSSLSRRCSVGSFLRRGSIVVGAARRIEAVASPAVKVGDGGLQMDGQYTVHALAPGVGSCAASPQRRSPAPAATFCSLLRVRRPPPSGHRRGCLQNQGSHRLTWNNCRSQLPSGRKVPSLDRENSILYQFTVHSR